MTENITENNSTLPPDEGDQLSTFSDPSRKKAGQTMSESSASTATSEGAVDLSVRIRERERESEVFSEEVDLSLATATEKPHCEYLCGVAGAGKTFLLKKRIEDDPTYGCLMATTGIASINLGTTTINSTLGYFDTVSLRENYDRGRLQGKLRQIILKQRVRNLCIDEVSMMDADQLDIIHQAVSEVNAYKTVKHPLGIVACGDFCQLSPVKAKWAFQAQCWPEFQKNVTKLTKIWRQTDGRFLEALNHLRCGNGKAALDILQTMTKLQFLRDKNYDGTTILSTNMEVDRHNFTCLQLVKGSVITTQSHRWGKQSGEWRLIPENLQLKENSLVMILANDSPAFTYCNGDTGHIVGFDGKEFLIKLVRNGEVVKIGKIHRTVTTKEQPEGMEIEDCAEASMGYKPFGKVSFDAEMETFHIGGVVYYPIRLAYGATTHKVQGLSLDRIQFDFRHKFAGNPASMYVAISRCKTPEGLRLVGDADTFVSRVKIDPLTLPWL